MCPPVGLPLCSRHPWTPMSERGCPQCYATLRAYIDEAHQHGIPKRDPGNRPERVRPPPKPRVYVSAPARRCATPDCALDAVKWSRTSLCEVHARDRRRRAQAAIMAEVRRAERQRKEEQGLLRRVVVEINGVVAHLSEHARRLGVHRSTVLRRWRKCG